MTLTERLSLDGRTALVTGAAAGIGRATALVLADLGAERLELVDLDGAGAAEVAAQIGVRATAHVADAADSRALAALPLRDVDLLVNAAGNVSSSPFLELEPAEWEAGLRSHARSVYVTCRLLVPGMVERRYGRVVNVASVAGKRGGGFLGKVPYATAKAAVNGLTKALAREVAPFGVRVNAVNPGLTDTRRVDALRADPEVWARCLAAVPLGRIAAPEEVATAIAFLLSDASAYLTGVTLNVDGGVAME